jgi:hypothetical protein
MATMNKKYNNPLATSVGQGITAMIQSRPTSTMLLRSTLGRRSMKAAMWLVIEARRRDHTGRHHDDNNSDCFPTFTTSITDKSYPKDFKPVGIPKYNGKQDPH